MSKSLEQVSSSAEFTLEIEPTVEHTIELLRENWDFVNARQNTARLGTKWLHKIEPGHILKFVCPDDDTIQPLFAEVESTELQRFFAITDDIAKRNHTCGDKERLREALERAYGEAFNESSLITIIWFTPLGIMPFSGFRHEELDYLLRFLDTGTHGLRVEALDAVLGALKGGHSIDQAIWHAVCEWDL